VNLGAGILGGVILRVGFKMGNGRTGRYFGAGTDGNFVDGESKVLASCCGVNLAAGITLGGIAKGIIYLTPVPFGTGVR
jgi:hypothetical protein